MPLVYSFVINFITAINFIMISIHHLYYFGIVHTLFGINRYYLALFIHYLALIGFIWY